MFLVRSILLPPPRTNNFLGFNCSIFCNSFILVAVTKSFALTSIPNVLYFLREILCDIFKINIPAGAGIRVLY
jgi:hypothetical protein